jgi:hypothetical protein
MKTTLLCLAALACATLTTSCVFLEKTRVTVLKSLAEETGEYMRPSQRKKPIASPHPEDYIPKEGHATAIPAKEDYYLYISPYAPEAGYVSSRKPPGSKVVCPYSGHTLILGDRKHIHERELPR